MTEDAKNTPADQPDEEERRRQAEQGAEAYGGDTDAGPSVTERDVAVGSERDQAEG